MARAPHCSPVTSAVVDRTPARDRAAVPERRRVGPPRRSCDRRRAAGSARRWAPAYLGGHAVGGTARRQLPGQPPVSANFLRPEHRADPMTSVSVGLARWAAELAPDPGDIELAQRSLLD